jgi:glutathione S-transferase
MVYYELMESTLTHAPLLYSFRRCPYAMRARMALSYAQVKHEIQEVDLKNKPAALLEISPKGTVPVLVFKDKRCLDESLDIIQWALKQHDPEHWLPKNQSESSGIEQLILYNDQIFKFHLNRFKYPSRYPDDAYSTTFHQQQCECFFNVLEIRLKEQAFLVGERQTLADVAVFPFVRQAARVEINWFLSLPFPHLHVWFNRQEKADLFKIMMKKHA